VTASTRSPVACGALGSYDRDRALRLAAALDGGSRVVHEDERSILMLDREPLWWSGASQRGLGWIEGTAWRGGAADWRAASRHGACGLVLEGRRRQVHSSINGLGSIYWMQDRGAVYFASEIDPLVQTASGPLSIDWDAWASIVALRFPAGERTPFAEIRRLEPFSVLRGRLRRFRPHSPAWPWAEAEPRLDRSSAAESLLDGLRREVAALDGPVIAPLSGGRDSRMVLCALAEAGKASVVLTVSDDEGDTFEEDLAAPVAAALRLPHERLRAQPERYAANWEERARLVEHQFVDHAWLVPLAQRIDGAGVGVADGFAIDALLQRGGRFYGPETLDRRHPRRASLALFDSMRQYGRAHLALAQQFQAPLVARARELFLTATKPFEGNPSQATLAFYRTRTARGVSCYPSSLLGSKAQVLAPAASDAVAIAALSATPEAREGDALYPAIFDLLAPKVGRLPSTSDTPRRGPHLPRCWRSNPALDAHRQRLADGPLAPHLSPELREWLNAPRRGELSPDLRLGMEAVSLLHSWWHRYREHLREVDPADLLS
jgi:hypothetical protein